MNHHPNPDESRNPATEPRDDFLGQACSPEFALGCAEPAEDIRPIVHPDGAPLPPRKSDPSAASTGIPDEVVEVPDADPGAPAAGEAEIACSAEFPKGCVDSEHGDAHA